jgi:hypothetical protein
LYRRTGRAHGHDVACSVAIGASRAVPVDGVAEGAVVRVADGLEAEADHAGLRARHGRCCRLRWHRRVGRRLEACEALLREAVDRGEAAADEQLGTVGGEVPRPEAVVVGVGRPVAERAIRQRLRQQVVQDLRVGLREAAGSEGAVVCVRSLVQVPVKDRDRLRGAEAGVLPDQAAVTDVDREVAVEATAAGALGRHIGDAGLRGRALGADDDLLDLAEAARVIRDEVRRSRPRVRQTGRRVGRADGLLGDPVDLGEVTADEDA